MFCFVFLSSMETFHVLWHSDKTHDVDMVGRHKHLSLLISCSLIRSAFFPCGVDWRNVSFTHRQWRLEDESRLKDFALLKASEWEQVSWRWECRGLWGIGLCSQSWTVSHPRVQGVTVCNRDLLWAHEEQREYRNTGHLSPHQPDTVRGATSEIICNSMGSTGCVADSTPVLLTHCFI